MKRRDFLALLPLAASSIASGNALGQDTMRHKLSSNPVPRGTDRVSDSITFVQSVDTLEPILSHATAANLTLAISQYASSVVSGGWKAVPSQVTGLELGNSAEAVIQLKRRLVSSSDMRLPDHVTDLFDEPLEAALRAFQARHGLGISGKVDEATYLALIVPVDVRFRQLKLNLQRVQTAASRLADRYVVVNIPAAAIEAVEGGKVARRHKAVVGRIDRRTPVLHSKLDQINFNPFWNVPKSIIRRDLIRYVRENPNYLTNNGIRIFDANGKEKTPDQIDWTTQDAVRYNFRQDPGPNNSMGHVKIHFPNAHSIYLHDTPTKSLFGDQSRFYSSGCVRVEQVEEFVAWILRDNRDWDLTAVSKIFSTGERVDVAVKTPVEVHTAYITAWANRQGTVSFREDVYGFDRAGKVSF